MKKVYKLKRGHFDRAKDEIGELDSIIGKKIVEAFFAEHERYKGRMGGYCHVVIILEDGTELVLEPDGEYGTCLLSINGNTQYGGVWVK